MSDTRGRRLRDARSRRFASAREAAIALAVPVSTYGAHERAQSPGGRDYGPDEAQQYAEFFGVTAEWLLTGYTSSAGSVADGAPTPQSVRKMPILGYIGTGLEAHFYSMSPRNFEYITAPRLVSKSTVALEIRGRSMGWHLDRWLVLYDDIRRPPTADLNGALCVVALRDGRVLIKTLRRSGTDRKFDLISQAADPIRGAAIRWAANVKAIIQRSTPVTDIPA